MPREQASIDALRAICELILDPLTSAIARPRLTYGFASAKLAAQIERAIAPRLDQHASYDRRADGELICARGGAAVDLIIDGVSARETARWIAEHTQYDRIYFYGEERPLHVSIGPGSSRVAFEMVRSATGTLIPRRCSFQSRQSTS